VGFDNGPEHPRRIPVSAGEPQQIPRQSDRSRKQQQVQRMQRFVLSQYMHHIKRPAVGNVPPIPAAKRT